MARGLAAASLVLLWMAVVAAGQATPGHPVNLSKPGAVEALARANPTHYEKVRGILEGIVKQPVVAVPGWIRTNFDARNVAYSLILLTSEPPKRHLAFTLDETRYEAVVTLTNVGAVVLPVK